ncbi:MAG: hypothetical protein EA351_01050 [Gemmatimonadales bacterium]|nr:MAG: hypothetical protein EA351_01050 [Gemmatimonadales bacterium]
MQERSCATTIGSGSGSGSGSEAGDRCGSWPRRPLSRKLRDHLTRKGFEADARRAGLEMLEVLEGGEPG